MSHTSPIKRVNLSLPQEVMRWISFFAERDGVSITTKTAELVRQGIEAEEDRVLVELAEERLQELKRGDAMTVSHEDFWKMIEKDTGTSFAA